MRSTLLKLTLAAALATASLAPAHAAVVLTYGGLATFARTPSYDESGFRTSQAGGLWNWNSSGIALGYWADSDVVIRAVDDSAFSLQSIDYIGIDGNLPSFDVIGELAGGGTTVQHVTLDASGLQTVSFGANFSNVIGIRFTQYLFGSGAFAFDNVRLDAAVAAVPEPASGALVTAALLGAALSRRRKKPVTLGPAGSRSSHALRA